MPKPLLDVMITNPLPTANEILARQITQALRDAELIITSNEEDVFRLLTAGSAKAGDWLQLLQEQYLFNSTPTEIDYATTNYSS